MRDKLIALYALLAMFGEKLETLEQRFAADARGAMSIKTAIILPIALAIGALVAGIIVPVGLGELVNASTVNWSSGATTLWNNLDVFAVLAVLGIFVGYMTDAF